MTLPIETIVIVAITVLVLVVVVAFFMGGASQPMSSITDSNALATGCVQLSTIYGCDPGNDRLGGAGLDGIKISGYTVSCGGMSNSLGAACCKLGYASENCAYAACRCPQ